MEEPHSIIRSLIQAIIPINANDNAYYVKNMLKRLYVAILQCSPIQAV